MLYRKTILLLLIVSMLSSVVVAPVAAQSERAASDTPACQSGEYGPQTGAVIVPLILRCTFATAHDTITIYPRRPFDLARPWAENLDDQNAVWVFDAGAQNRASLIIDFHPNGAALVADLYDDQNGDGQVAYRLEGGRVMIDESRFWSVRVRADAGWWTRAGAPNMNLEVLVDGQTYAAFGSEPVLRDLHNDGVVDVDIHVYDENDDGRPDWEWIDFWHQAPVESAVYRTMLMVNPQRDEPPMHSPFPWPYLGAAYSIFDFVHGPRTFGPAHFLVGPDGQPYGVIQSYDYRFAPLQMYWEQARIAFVGEFVASRGGEHSWFMYSVKRITPGQLTDANFEAPFGFYDLAQDHDGLPEAQARLETDLPEDSKGFLDRPNAALRYSWDQDNDGQWDYKIDMRVGLNIQPIQLGQLQFRVQPYETLPQLVKQPSNVVLFVARAGREYKLRGPLDGGREILMEGIYTWTTVPARDYVAGVAAFPEDSFQNVPIGDRAEIRSTTVVTSPELYMSAVDQSLHLRYAERGSWQISDNSDMHYADRDGDGYFDEWALTAARKGNAGVDEQRLNIARDLAVYVNGNDIFIRKAKTNPALFQSAPPTNHAEWQALGAAINQHKPSFQANNLRAMFEAIPGPEFHISGALMQDYRFNNDGSFRFALNLRPGFKSSGTLGPDIQDLPTGDYIVTYDGSYTVQPLTKPDIKIDITKADAIESKVAQPETINLQLRNAGNADLKNLSLVVEAVRNTEVVTLTQQPMNILSGVPTPFGVEWQPRAPGEWMLKARLENADHQVLGHAERSIMVGALPQNSLDSLLRFTTTGGQRLALTLMLLLLGLVAGLALWVAVKDRVGEQT